MCKTIGARRGYNFKDGGNFVQAHDRKFCKILSLQLFVVWKFNLGLKQKQKYPDQLHYFQSEENLQIKK